MLNNLNLNFSDDDDAIETIPDFPKVYRYGVNKIVTALEPLVKKGLSSVLLFGVIKTLPKDDFGTHANSDSNPVLRAINKIKTAFPNLLIACDVSEALQNKL